MPKLDVGVGDEFPTEEIRRDADGVVHHHHYYYRRRRHPLGFLRFILWIVLVFAVLRALHYISWMGDYSILPWTWMPHGYFRLVSTLLVIVAAVFGLYYLRCRDDRLNGRREDGRA